MTKREKIAAMLTEAGFEPDSFGFSVVKGPKAKSDILECWSTGALKSDGRHVEIYSAYTMTELSRCGLQVVPNYRETCLYGDYVAEPANKPNFIKHKL